MPDRAEALDDESGTELPDLTELALPAVLASAESALANVLRRVVAAAEEAGHTYAAFGNAP